MENEKPKKHGGARPGAGRKPQSSPKKLREAFFDNLNNTNEIAELTTMWHLFKSVAKDKAMNGDTEDLQWIFSRILPVPKEQELNVEHDITSNGQTIQTAYTFSHTESDDWK